MKKFFRLLFNYYLVFRSCWFVVLFLFIGFFALVIFDQGQDILKTLSLTGDATTIRQTWFVFLAVSWWAWQSFRASRILLHFSYFNFWTYLPSYSLRAQVLIPRLLATMPYFILGIAVYRTSNTFTAFSLLLFSSAIWLFVFLHFRKEIILRLRSWKPFIPAFIPDYIPIKNGTYPVAFIWTKQRRWFMFRIGIVAAFFLLFYFFPVNFPQYLGSATVVLLGFGSWLILAGVVSFIEKYLRFPVSLSILLLVVIFSFFNNNHTVKSLNKSPYRPSISEHFDTWITPKIKSGDTTNIYMVMAEGGGLRSAYWTTSILNQLHDFDSTITNNTYAYSCVSGGGLGSVMFTTLQNHKELNPPKNETAPYLNKDLLAPVTASLIFTDLLQKFLPLPVEQFDRSQVLEASFENCLPDPTIWQNGFLAEYANSSQPVMLINATHVESGTRTILSNVALNELKQNQVHDYFVISKNDVSISTAIGIGSRFPFITPPALIKYTDGKTWGNLVDGGYYENLGMQTMLDLYNEVKQISIEKGYPVRFKFIAIRNTKAVERDKPLLGMVEAIAPGITFANIWSNNSNEVISNGRKLLASKNDELYVISLQRDDNENIPLGWYLSPAARNNLNKQLSQLSDSVFHSISR